MFLDIPFVGLKKHFVKKKREFLLNMSCFWTTKIVSFTSFRDQFNSQEVKKLVVESEKLWSGELGNMRYFYFLSLQKFGRRPGANVIFLPKNFILKYFQKLMRFQLLLDQDKYMGKVDFPTRNTVDRFLRDALLKESSYSEVYICGFIFHGQRLRF